MSTVRAITALLAAGLGLYWRGYRAGSKRGRLIESDLRGAGIVVNVTGWD